MQASNPLELPQRKWPYQSSAHRRVIPEEPEPVYRWLRKRKGLVHRGNLPAAPPAVYLGCDQYLPKPPEVPRKGERHDSGARRRPQPTPPDKPRPQTRGVRKQHRGEREPEFSDAVVAGARCAEGGPDVCGAEQPRPAVKRTEKDLRHRFRQLGRLWWGLVDTRKKRTYTSTFDEEVARLAATPRKDEVQRRRPCTVSDKVMEWRPVTPHTPIQRLGRPMSATKRDYADYAGTRLWYAAVC